MANNVKWVYKGKDMTEISDFPEGTLGFIYLITDHTNGKFYIGQKKIFSRTKRHFGKKELALMTDKRLKTYEYVTKPMRKWAEYTGSCAPLNEAIEKGATYTKEILQLCRNKAEVTYFELKYQFAYGVIEPGVNSYNGNISGKYYRKLFEKSDA